MARPKLNPDVVDKVCPFCGNTFSVSFYLRNKRTYCNKKCANADPKVKSKIVTSQTETFMKKYGMHPMKTEQTKENLKSSVKKAHGVEWASQMAGWYDKVKKNNLVRHGIEHFNNAPKIKETCLKKYGKENYMKTEEYKEKYTQTCLRKYGVPHASKANSFKVEHYKNIFEKFMSHPLFQNFNPCFPFEEYRGVSFKEYKFQCKRCGTEQFHSINNGKFPICPTCDKMNASFFQKEVYDYLLSITPTSIPIQINDRKILHPKELDIVIPSKNLAIECDGLVWHSETIGKKNKIYHLNKTKAAASRGFRLIHIFDTEWNNKQDIVKSLLNITMNGCSQKIHGRKCIVSIINSSTCSQFLEKNHIQGVDHSTIKLGLFHENELVSVMTFVRSRFDKKIEWEMSRFCNKLGTIINGGASKLFSHFVKNYSPQSIVSYSDRRYFDGKLYVKLGFQFVHNSNPNYHYIIDNYQTIQNRVSWQKHKLHHKLPNFNPELSEWENMKINGFDRIWDCGNSKWIWKP